MTTPTIHGYFVATNTASYGVHLSEDGTLAKLIMNDKDCTVTDWLNVVWCVVGDEDDGEFEPIIDPNGYNIPLNMVVNTY